MSRRNKHHLTQLNTGREGILDENNGSKTWHYICKEDTWYETGGTVRVLGKERAEMDSLSGGCLQKVLLDKCCDVQTCRSCCSTDNIFCQ